MDAVPAIRLIAQDPGCREAHGNRTGRELLRFAEGENTVEDGRRSGGNATLQDLADGVEMPPEDLPLQRAARGIEVRNHEEEIRFDDGEVVHLSATPSLSRSGGAPGGNRGLRRRDPPQAGGGRPAGGRSPKDEFLALLSHELRNPLAPILTAAQLMHCAATWPRRTNARSSCGRPSTWCAWSTICSTSRAWRAGRSRSTQETDRARQRGGQGRRGDRAAARAAAAPLECVGGLRRASPSTRTRSASPR